MRYPGTVLKTFQILARKELGQNFLTDPNTARRIAEFAGITGDDVVLEIGAGLGALTIHAARMAQKVYAVEKDSRLTKHLADEVAESGHSNVELINQDIFKVDIKSIARDTSGENPGKKLIVIGNLPYNISSQVLFRLAENREFISRAILMFQKELAERICASPGNRVYGRLSAVMQYCSTVRIMMDVGGHLFFPRPDVESSVMEVDFFNEGSLSREKELLLFRIIKAAFSKRRKTLRNSLTGNELGIDRDTAEKALAMAAIDPSRRAETLGVEDFKKLCEAFHATGSISKLNCQIIN
ncbi:MAG: 16S rRNA (adenine(1518)-N(6)/adenine(1519)-N(6))-dimethyltransferase RsmA [Desulfamplus sp.]|nr:16S rRNA (adenine(1518)-N(6)/adenine(1519)-N(6))-dimethyltransferase RsmA [Desulfamplus sp.]